MLLSDVTRAMACSPSSSASNESCLHFVAIAGLANRPKNIRIHLAVSRVRFCLLRFNSSGNFCDGGAICSRGTPIQIRTTSFRTCGLGQGSVAKAEEAEGMSGSWRADWWLGTISLSQGCFRMSQVCGLCSDDGLHGSYSRLGHNFLFADHPPGTRTNCSSMSALPC